MKPVVAVLMSLALMFAFSQKVLAKTVYLKNGDEIDCQKVWKEGGRINVLINRDTLIDFAPGDVNQDKTFGHKPVKKKIRHHKKRHGTGPKAARQTSKAGSNARTANAKPVVKTPPPATKPAAPQPVSRAPQKNAPPASH